MRTGFPRRSFSTSRSTGSIRIKRERLSTGSNTGSSRSKRSGGGPCFRRRPQTSARPSRRAATDRRSRSGLDRDERALGGTVQAGSDGDRPQDLQDRRAVGEVLDTEMKSSYFILAILAGVMFAATVPLHAFPGEKRLIAKLPADEGVLRPAVYPERLPEDGVSIAPHRERARAVDREVLDRGRPDAHDRGERGPHGAHTEGRGGPAVLRESRSRRAGTTEGRF